MAQPPDPTQLFYEMETSAIEGHLDMLKSQLARWEAGVTGNNFTQPDYLGFLPGPQDEKDLRRALGLGDNFNEPIDLIYFLLNRLLHRACRENQVDVARYLLEERKGPITYKTVMIGLVRQSFDVLEMFLAHGWDINRPLEEHGGPILRMMVKLGKEVHVRWCLEHGADPHGCNDKGHLDVLSEAGVHGSIGKFQLLAAYGANFSRSNALHAAAKRHDQKSVQILEWLLDVGKVPINLREYEYDPEKSSMRTALHCAIWQDATENVRYLLQRGIDASLEDMQGRTARDVAGLKGKAEILRLLDAEMA